jgi:hypothetical protein
MSSAEIREIDPSSGYTRYINGTMVRSSFPGSGHRAGKVKATKEDAYDAGKVMIKEYEQNSFPGGMGQVLGVVEVEGGFDSVVNTYYSPS